MTQQLRKGRVGRLEFTPPEGVPDGDVSLTIYLEGTTELEPVSALPGGAWPQTITPSPSTTLTQVAQDGAVLLSVGSIANFIQGEPYQLTDAEGVRHAITVKGVDTVNTRLKINRDFDHDLPVGTPIVGLRFAFAIPLEMMGETLRGVRAEWSYTISGRTVVHDERFDVVSEPFNLAPTLMEVDDQAIGAAEHIGSIEQLQRLSRGAMRVIRTRLTKYDLYPDLVRGRDSLELAAIYAILWAAYRNDSSKQKVAQGFQDLFEATFTQAVNAHLDYDTNDDQVADEEEKVRPVFRCGVS